MSSDNDSSPDEFSGEEGEGLDAIGDDYKAIPELDHYEDVDLEAEDAASVGMNMGDRRAAENAMNRRDLASLSTPLSAYNQQERLPNLPNALGPIEEGDEGDQSRSGMDSIMMSRRKPGQQYHGSQDDDMDRLEGVNLEDFTGPLNEWIAQEQVQIEVRKRFRNFLQNFKDSEQKFKYQLKIAEMCNSNKCTLEVSYTDLSQEHPVLGIWVADCPRQILPLLDAEALHLVQNTFANYEKIAPHVFCRISDLPIVDNLRDLRQAHLNGFILVKGVVTRRTSVFPQLNLIKWDCMNCGYIAGPFAVQSNGTKNDLKEYKPGSCAQCQKKVFRLNTTETIYQNFQKITLCESPGSVPAGRIPRSREVILQNDLCDSIRPGEQVSVAGIYTNRFEASLNINTSFPVFSTVIEANHIYKDNDYMDHCELTDTDIEKIQELARDPHIEERLVASCAPSIYGHAFIKRAILMAMFGGQTWKRSSKHRVRGDINVLIMGDPGVAKSQFLKYVEKAAARAVYATGKGASAVGLTASVRKDPLTREWTLEGGALVLADRGICLIDEFDKMKEQDRVSIHEAMEQQSISISKAGIVTTLQARCAVIAAANPIKGRYDSSLTFIENVDLTDPILSRFDVLCVVKDVVDPVMDERLAFFVAGNHIRAHPRATEEEMKMENSLTERSSLEIDQALFKKYIVYAKQKCRPELNNINKNKVTAFYAKLRQKSSVEGSIPVAVRHIESILRMACARAKMHLRDSVNEEDVDAAIKCMLTSFIETQKFSVMQQLKSEFREYLTTGTDSNTLLLHLLRQEMRSMQWYNNSKQGDDDDGGLEEISVDFNEFAAKAKEMGVTQLKNFFKTPAFTNSFNYDKRGKKITKKWN